MNLSRSTLAYFGTQMGITVSGFVATFVIARLLGPDILGVYSVVVAMLFWLTLPASAIGRAINKRISEGRSQSEYLSAGFVLATAMILVLAVPVFLFSAQVDEYVGVPVSSVFLLLLGADILFQTVLSSLRGQKKVAQSGGVQAIERVFRTVGQVSLVLLGYGVIKLVLGHATALLLAAIVGIGLFEVRPTLPSRESFRSLLEYARYSWLGAVKTRAFAWMDTIVLYAFVTPSLVGIYEVAWSLASVFALASLSIQKTLFPELSELGVGEEYNRIRHFLGEAIVFTGVFAIPGLFGAAVLGPDILAIYRPEFTRGATILLVLIVARTVAAYGRQFLSAINAIDRPDVAFRINLAFVLVNLLLNVTLIPVFGWYGAAIATTVSASIILVLSYLAFVSLIGAPTIPYGEIGRQIAAALVMTVVVSVCSSRLPSNQYVTIALVCLGAGIYGAVLCIVSAHVRRKIRMLTPAVESF